MGVRNTRVCGTNKFYHQVQKITAPPLHGRLRCNLDEMKEQYQKSYFHDYFKLNRRNAPVVGDDLGGSHTWLGILPTPAQYSTRNHSPSMFIIVSKILWINTINLAPELYFYDVLL